ncbi:MAG TPA: GAF domain-containing sensor histidine kinase [Longimicrobiales bacterium]
MHRVPGWLVPAIAGLVAALSAVALVDWVVPVEIVSRTEAGYVPMSPWTAAGLLLAAAGLWLVAPERGGRRRRLGTMVCALLLMTRAGVSLVQNGLGVDLGIDGLLFPRAIARTGVPFGGHLAPATAWVFLAFGVALLLLLTGRARAAVAAQYLALGAGLVAVLALVGYAYGVQGLYFLASAVRVAPSAAAGILATAVGLFLSRPEHGPASVVTAPDVGGLVVRRLLPLIVLVPVAVGWLRLEGERAGYYGTELGTALAAIAMMVLLGTAIWVGGAALGRLDRRRSSAEAARARLLVQERAARADAEREARAEEALRRAAEAISAAVTIEDVVRRIAEGALEATDAAGVVVKRVRLAEDVVEVIAVAGRSVPPVGSRGPYRGSFTEAALIEGRVKAVPVVEETRQPFSPGLREVCGRCRAAVVPLVAGGRPIGALTLVRPPEREPFREDELARAHAFGDLAALAFLKAQLLEDAQRSRDEVLRAAERRARLIRGFSHDVKNPLGAASGQLALLEEGVAGALADAQRDAVSRARRAVEAAVDLIDDLVDLVRAEAGQLSIERQPTDVSRAAAEMAEEYRPQAEARRIELRVEVAGRPRPIDTDPSRVRQILANLLSNAVKYTPEGGRITVRVEERADGAPAPGAWLAVDVANTGPHIPPEKQEFIFQEFTRLEPGGRRGGGLGLAISRQVARALGGDVTVRSEPGEGPTFTLWIPADAAATRGRRAA